MRRSAGELCRRALGIGSAVALMCAVVIGGAQMARAADPLHRLGVGAVGSLAVDPVTPSTLYAVGTCTGVVKSTDGGDTWRVTNTGLPSVNTTSIVVAPKTPNTLYAVVVPTNDALGGVFKSTNGGESWEAAGNGLPYDSNILAIALDPKTPDTLYVGRLTGNVFYNDGVLKSTDGAESWEPAGSGLPADVGSFNAIVIDPKTPSTLYVGSRTDPGRGVFKSSDAGGTWSAANTGLPSVGVGPLAIDPVTPTTLYAGVGTGVGQQKIVTGLFKSTNGGSSWSVADEGLPPLLDSFVLVAALVVDPITPSTLYAGMQTGDVFKSTNGGQGWQPADAGLPGYPGNPLGLVIDPKTPSTLYAAAGGPLAHLFKSTNGGDAWAATGLGGVACGDGVVCGGEEGCDDGNTASGDGCDSNCTATGCGNGIVTAGEECDDGNAISSDGCTNHCTICGNGIVTPPEQCDDGNTIDGDGCEANCTRPRCGNGIVDAGEQCDDGNLINGDGCEPNCTLPRCGNRIVDRREQCDDGNTIDGDGCESNCTLPGCGNGIVDSGEQCDDGNNRSCDGCSPACQTESGVRCGDGIVNTACGEECDDGNTVNGDACEANCTLARCGNGILDAGEECDDGNLNPFDGCTSNCTVCGNGIVTPPEECDDGNTNPSDGCTNACTFCGNGIVTPPEGCDDGNLVNGDSCDADCIAPNVCGNGVVDAGEECDNAGVCIGSANAGTFCTADTQCPGGACKTFGGDGCAANCTLESEVPFNFVPGVVGGTVIAPGASGVVMQPGVTITRPLTGGETLTIGKERNGEIPVVIKAATVQFAGPQMRLHGCCGSPPPGAFMFMCPRAVAAKTCGGTIVEPDGVTGSTDCTPGFTAGDSVCKGKNACAFVHGPGNSASGVIGCDGLDGVNVDLTQDYGGSSGISEPPVLSFSGTGGPGSAVLFGTTAIGIGPLRGPDGVCTDDDPQDERGTPIIAAVTTGAAIGRVLNVGSAGNTVGPFSATGAPFRCDALRRGDASGAALVSTFTRAESNVVFTSVLAAAASPAPCVGDCDGSGDVSVNELVNLVNIALGDAQLSACPHGVSGGAAVDVALLVQAVNDALRGCGGG